MVRFILVSLVIFSFLSAPTFAQNNKEQRSMLAFLAIYNARKYPNTDLSNYLYISFKRQMMFHIVNKLVAHTFVISTGKNGLGNIYGTGKTPIGLHTIVEKFGYNAPKGSVFKGRTATGEIASIYQVKADMPEDKITSRIMWLKGDELGINSGGKADSYNRKIYIHGTSEEGLIGKAQSEGCIRMKNNDIIQLFSFSYIGMKVLILDE